MKKESPPGTLRIIAVILLILVALNALAAGYSFITDPSGGGLGITTDYLRPSAPLHDYFIPGLVLFLVNGILSLVIAFFAIKQLKHYPLLILLQGAVFVGWIAVQVTMVTKLHPLQLIIALIGFTLIISGWLIQPRKIA